MDTGDTESILYMHSISPANRVLPSSSRWNSIELNYNLFPQSRNAWGYESLPTRFAKSIDFKLTITNKKNFKRFIYASSAFVSLIVILCLLLHFLPNKHRHHHGATKDLTLALKQALIFFDAQKCTQYVQIYTRKCTHFVKTNLFLLFGSWDIAQR